jgi:hypothetical protein
MKNYSNFMIKLVTLTPKTLKIPLSFFFFDGYLSIQGGDPFNMELTKCR